jgi:hypothetical protein
VSKNNPGASIVAKQIRKGSIGVEIGVWEGASSLEFAERTGHLHLVDPWPGRDDQYQRVKALFLGRPVTIHRMTSERFFAGFKNLADWVYIDGLHDYESVMADLIGAASILMREGVIYGDDYGKKEGVQEAVDEYCRLRNCEPRLLGLGQYAIP